ncbi:DNA-directed RNA polymerase subunit H [Candidatus Pacearchaeota archaeon]|nr:DNA-directed RNA polymerase subunit H [Candidatus Pacearchaeota archaeon]
MQHILQPKHIILKEEEANKLLRNLNVNSNQLPKIKLSDPAVPMGCKFGDIIKIERFDAEKRKKFVYYRVVV